mgnify:FL=1
MVFSYFSRILGNVKRIDLQNKELKEWINMGTNDFNFYNSENDGYRGGFGDYTDPIPAGPGAPGGPEQPRKHHGFPTKAVALLLACAVVGGGAGVGGAALYRQMDRGDTVIYESERPTVEVDTVANSNGGEPMTPEQLYASNLASCVGITVSTTSVNIFGQTTTSAASGSGFVLTQDGYIVTNYHVIEDAAKDSSVSIEVSFADGKQYTAKLVGGEQDNDVAVLKIEASDLTPVKLGDSDQLVVGEGVYTIGNPLGELTYSLTDGLVSALDRLITTTSTNPSTGAAETTTLNVLQTNCDNSGGPLFDSYGNVVGIVTAKYTQSSSGVSAEGLGFALPINDVKEIITDLIENGYVTGKPYMGVQVTSVPDYAQHYGVSAGAYVESVADGSCAQKAGLQADDIIIAIDDTAIDSSTALTAALSSGYKAGDTAKLTVLRGEDKMELTITFDEKNEQTEAANQPQQESNQQVQQQPSTGWPFGGFLW